MSAKNKIKTIFGIILTVIASIFLISGFILLIAPFDPISVRITSFIIFFVIGIIPLIFGIKLLRSNVKKNIVSQIPQNNKIEQQIMKREENILPASPEKETTQERQKETAKETPTGDNKSNFIPLYDDIQIFYENNYGEKNWHTLDSPKVGKNWFGDLYIYANGRDNDTITFNLKRLLKLKIDDELTDVEEYFEPIKKCFQEIVDEYKTKADNIVKNIEGFDKAMIFHCAIHNTIALSKELKGIAVFSKDCNFAKTIDEVKSTSFNESKSIITFYLNNEEMPKAYIQITSDFGEPRKLYEEIKEAIESIR